jgi:hypothetical protein
VIARPFLWTNLAQRRVEELFFSALSEASVRRPLPVIDCNSE